MARVLAGAATLSLPLLAPTEGLGGYRYEWTGKGDLNWRNANNWESIDGGLGYPGENPGGNQQGDTAVFDTKAVGTLNGTTINPGSVNVGFLEVQGVDEYGDMVSFFMGNSTYPVLYFNTGQPEITATIELHAKASLTFNALVQTSPARDLVVRNDSSLGGVLSFGGGLRAGGVNDGKNITFETRNNALIKVTALQTETVRKTGLGTLLLDNEYNGSHQFKNLVFDGGIIDISANYYRTTDYLGSRQGGTLYLKNDAGLDNIFVIKDYDRTSTVQNIIFSPNATLKVLRAENYDDTVTRDLQFTDSDLGAITLDQGGNKISVGMRTTLTLAKDIQGGKLTKDGPGELRIFDQNFANTFNGLEIHEGTVRAAALWNDAWVKIGGQPSPVGMGDILVKGGSSHLIIDSMHPDLKLTGVEFLSGTVTGQDVNENFITILNTEAVNFTGGTIDFGGRATNLNTSGKVTLDATNFTNAGMANLNISGSLHVLNTSSQIQGSGINVNFVGKGLQEISAGPVNSSLNFQGMLHFQGDNERVIKNSVTQLGAQGGIKIEDGTLTLGKPNQIASGTTIVFGDTENKVPVLNLAGFSQNLDKVIVASNVGGYFDMGSSGNSTTLNINEFVGDVLRIRGWKQGDIVHTNTQLDEDNVWFHGFARGGKWVYADGSPAQPGAQNSLLAPTAGLLVSKFDASDDTKYPDNKVLPDNLRYDWDWHSPKAWEGDDAFAIPDAPGTTAIIKHDVGVLDLGGFYLKVNKKTTIGAITVIQAGYGNPSSVSGTGSFVFDSGNPNQPFYLKAESDGGYIKQFDIRIPIELKSNLEIQNTANSKLTLSGKISGTGDIHVNPDQRPDQYPVQFTSNQSDFEGDIHVHNNGGILIGSANSLGKDTNTIHLGDTLQPGDPYGTVTFASTDATLRVVTNPVQLNADLRITGIHLKNSKPIELDRKLTLEVNRARTNGVTNSYGTIDSPDVILETKIEGKTEDAGIIVSSTLISGTHYRDFVRFDNPDNSFKGGVKATGDGGIGVIIGTNQTSDYGLVIGEISPGKNYLGAGPITIQGNNAQLQIKTGDNGRDVHIHGVDKSTPIIDIRNSHGFMIEGTGKIFLDDSKARIDFTNSQRNEFKSNEIEISGATVNLNSSELELRGVSTVMTGGEFKVGANSKLNWTPQGGANRVASIQGGTISLNGSDATLDIYDGFSSTGTPLVFDFSRGNITTTSTASGTLSLKSTCFSFNGGTLSPDANLLLRNSSIRSNQSNFILNVASVKSDSDSVIEDSIKEVRSDRYQITGGYLQSTSDNQLKGASGNNNASLEMLQSSSFMTNHVSEFGSFFLANDAQTNSFRLGASGKLTFGTLTNWANGGAGNYGNGNTVFLVQGFGGGWTENSQNYIRFLEDPRTESFGLTPLALEKISFTGYESGARVIKESDNYYYIVPFGTGSGTNYVTEWTGNPSAGYTGVNWKESENWINADGSSSIPIPGTPGGLNSIVFRDIDMKLSKKTIIIDENYTLAKIGFETVNSNFTIKAEGGGKLTFDGGTEAAQIRLKGGTGDTAIKAPVELKTDLLIPPAAHSRNLIFAQEITGAGALKRLSSADGVGGDGMLVLRSRSNTFNGLVFEEGILALGPLNGTTMGGTDTPLGIGTIIFGKDASSNVHLAFDSTIYDYDNSTYITTSPEIYVYAPKGVRINGAINFLNSGKGGVTRNDLTIDVSGSTEGFQLAPGENVMTLSSGTNSLTVMIKGTVRDSDSQRPSSLVLRRMDYSSSQKSALVLTGDNTFSGGVRFETPVQAYAALGVGSDNALGTGPIFFTGGCAKILATDADGYSLIRAPQGYRLIQSPFVFLGTQEHKITFGGNILLDDRTLDIGNTAKITFYGDLESNYVDTANIGLVFGPNFAITGNNANLLSLGGYINFRGAESTYSGGTNLTGYHNLHVDSVVDANGTILRGPLGTGPVHYNAWLIPWSTNPNVTARVIHNEIQVSNSINLDEHGTPSPGNFANTLVFASEKEIQIQTTGTSSAYIGSGKTLQIDSPLKTSGGTSDIFNKKSYGNLTLTNPANEFRSIEVKQGAMVARSGSHKEGLQDTDMLIAPKGTPGRIGQFGEGALTVQHSNNAGSLDVSLDNYAGKVAALATETMGDTTVSVATRVQGTTPYYEQPFLLTNTTSVFIAGGSPTGEGFGLKGSGRLRIDGDEGAELHGQKDYSQNNPNAGWLIADTILKDSGKTLLLGMNLRANHLVISGGGILQMMDANRLSGVTQLVFGDTIGGSQTSGSLNLNGQSQALRMDIPGAPNGGEYSTIHVAEGAEGNILLESDTATPNNPLTFTFGRISAESVGKLNFRLWNGEIDTGMGATRIIVTGYRRGEVIPDVYIWGFNMSNPYSDAALVKINNDGQRVLVPMGNELRWTGKAAEALFGQENSETVEKTYWERTHTPLPGTPDLSNWDEIGNTGTAGIWPGNPNMEQGAGRIVSFDTAAEVDTHNNVWKWNNLVIPITSDGYGEVSSGFENYSTKEHAIAGTIYLHGNPTTNPLVTFAALKDCGVFSQGATNPTLVLDAGKDAEVANIIVSIPGRLRFNVPIYLLSEVNQSTTRTTTLVVNTTKANSFVELNESIIGGSGAFVEKIGAGHLFIRGNNGDDQSRPGLAAGIILRGGHLYLGSRNAIGAISQRATLNLESGTLHTVADWYEEGHYNDTGTTWIPANQVYTPGTGATGAGELKPANLEVPNDYRFMGSVTYEGPTTLTFRNIPSGRQLSEVVGNVKVPSTVTIADPRGRLEFDGKSLTSTSHQTLAVEGPGSALFRKSNSILGVDIIANASAADGATALVEVQAKDVGMENPQYPNITASVINRGHGELRLGNFDTASDQYGSKGSYGAVINEGPGVTRVGTTDYVFRKTLSNTGTPDPARPGGSAEITISGAGNFLAGGITANAGGSVNITAPTNVTGAVSITNDSLLRVAASVRAVSPASGQPSGTSNAAAYVFSSGGRLLLDVTQPSPGTFSAGSLSAGASGSVSVSGGVLDFLVAADGTHGVLAAGQLTTSLGSTLLVRHDAGFDATQFVLGYEINLFDADAGAGNPAASAASAPGVFTNGAGWFFGKDVSITHGGAAIPLPAELKWKFDRLATEGVIYLGGAVSPGLYWDGTDQAATWNHDQSNENWRLADGYELTRALVAQGLLASPFTNTSRVVFDIGVGNAPSEKEQALAVKIDNTTPPLPGQLIEVHSMLVTGHGSDFVFTGDAIKINGPYISSNHEYAGIRPALEISERATARFDNAGVEAPSLTVRGSSKATLVWNSGDSSSKFVFSNSDGITPVRLLTAYDTLVLEQNDDPSDITFGDGDTVIAGAGNLVKTGTGKLILDAPNAYNAPPAIGGAWQTFGGTTTVKAGELIIQKGLGNGSVSYQYDTHDPGNPDALQQGSTTRVYHGAIIIDNGATLTLNQGLDEGQRLAGPIGHDDTPIGSNGYTSTPSSDGTLTLRGGYFEIAARYNSFQGTLNISDNTHLRLYGGIGTIRETFDGGTPFESTYYLNHYYSGQVTLGDKTTLEHANSRDYQYFGGYLIGPPTSIFRKTGSAPFYFQGNAQGYGGHTRIENGLFSISSANGAPTVYSSGAGSFLVGRAGGGAPGILQTASGTELKATEFALYTGGTLIAGPSYFSAPTAPVAGLLIEASNKITIEGGTSITLHTGKAMVSMTVDGTPENPDGTTQTTKLAAGAIKFAPQVALANTGGKIRIEVVPTYIPAIEDKEFLLMENVTITGNTAQELGADHPLMTGLFERTEDFDLRSGLWKLIYKDINNLYLVRTKWTGVPNVPEPSTYALCGGLGALALAFWRRRKNRARQGRHPNEDLRK
ncbi:MAG: hypothetical protein LBG65_03695 [Puniceicoccales bacterium]|nr:hypothetical protein [Puniceicoccales bacterium]